MINQISWLSYWIAIGIILVFYYIIICFKYYLDDIKQILAAKSKSLFKNRLYQGSIGLNNNIVSTKNDNLKKDSFSETDSTPCFKKEQTHQDLFPVINKLVQEIKMMLEDAAQKNLVKQELLYALQLLLKKYPAVRKSEFENIVTNYILTECLNHCSIHLEEEEVKMLWVK